MLYYFELKTKSGDTRYYLGFKKKETKNTDKAHGFKKLSVNSAEDVKGYYCREINPREYNEISNIKNKNKEKTYYCEKDEEKGNIVFIKDKYLELGDKKIKPISYEEYMYNMLKDQVPSKNEAVIDINMGRVKEIKEKLNRSKRKLKFDTASFTVKISKDKADDYWNNIEKKEILKKHSSNLSKDEKNDVKNKVNKTKNEIKKEFDGLKAHYTNPDNIKEKSKKENLDEFVKKAKKILEKIVQHKKNKNLDDAASKTLVDYYKKKVLPAVRDFLNNFYSNKVKNPFAGKKKRKNIKKRTNNVINNNQKKETLDDDELIDIFDEEDDSYLEEKNNKNLKKRIGNLQEDIDDLDNKPPSITSGSDFEEENKQKKKDKKGRSKFNFAKRAFYTTKYKKNKPSIEVEAPLKTLVEEAAKRVTRLSSGKIDRNKKLKDKYEGLPKGITTKGELYNIKDDTIFQLKKHSITVKEKKEHDSNRFLEYKGVAFDAARKKMSRGQGDNKQTFATFSKTQNNNTKAVFNSGLDNDADIAVVLDSFRSIAKGKTLFIDCSIDKPQDGVKLFLACKLYGFKAKFKGSGLKSMKEYKILDKLNSLPADHKTLSKCFDAIKKINAPEDIAQILTNNTNMLSVSGTRPNPRDDHK